MGRAAHAAHRVLARDCSGAAAQAETAEAVVPVRSWRCAPQAFLASSPVAFHAWVCTSLSDPPEARVITHEIFEKKKP